MKHWMFVIIATCQMLLGAQSAGDRDGPWTQQLELLHPSRPLAYFELAEDVADAAQGDADRRLARRLFALAGALDPERLGRSASLALADLTEEPHVKRRMLALAALRGAPVRNVDATTLFDRGDVDLTVAVALSEAFSYYRRGQGSRAASALRPDETSKALQALDRLLPSGSDGFLEECRRYNGKLRPTLSEDDDMRLLRIETGLLAGSERSWSSDLLLAGGRPLVEVDPDRMDESLDIDVSRSVYRDGSWRAAPEP